jgi:hypothetical protein
LVAELLQASGYSLQANRKTREGPQHPDRDAQFHYILDQVRRFQKRRQPAISVDTKKKELVGDFRNAAREWRRAHPNEFGYPASSFPSRARRFPTASPTSWKDENQVGQLIAARGHFEAHLHGAERCSGTV